MLKNAFEEVTAIHLFIRVGAAQAAGPPLLVNEADIAGIEADLKLVQDFGFQERLIHEGETGKHFLELLRFDEGGEFCFCAFFSVNDRYDLAIGSAAGCDPHLLLLVKCHLFSINLILEVYDATDYALPVKGNAPSAQFALVEVCQDPGPEWCEDECSSIEQPVPPAAKNKGAVF